MFQLIVSSMWFGLCMQSAGHREKFAAKPMLRIVNMQKRLRPVYPGLGAIHFAMGVCDLLLLGLSSGPRLVQVAGNSEI